jgi:hypothetical protein
MESVLLSVSGVVVGILFIYLGGRVILKREFEAVPYSANGWNYNPEANRQRWIKRFGRDYPKTTGLGAVLVGLLFILVGLGLLFALAYVWIGSTTSLL